MEEAVDVEVGVGVGVALAFALAVGLAFGVELAFGVAVALAVGLTTAAASAWVEAFGLALALADDVDLVVADDLVLVLVGVADGLAVPLALADAEALGVADAAGAVYACSRYTGRNAIFAVVEIRLMTDDAAWPGTVTSSRSLPICWTWAPELPVPFTRDSRTDWASSIAPLDGAPFKVAACSTTWVPLDRSSPSLTWKTLPFQLLGLNVWLPVIVKNMIRTRTPSAASVRPGYEPLLLGGANCRLPFNVPRCRASAR